MTRCNGGTRSMIRLDYTLRFSEAGFDPDASDDNFDIVDFGLNRFKLGSSERIAASRTDNAESR